MAAVNQDQVEHWRSARQWVSCQEQLDALMQPVLDLLLAEADLRPGQLVLDIGCGTGASTVAAAGLVGSGGHVTGADVSGIMLERARERADEAGLGNLDFFEGDVQVCDLTGEGFDRVISRFGVMFFDDPVTAFHNILRALRAGGSMVALAWSGPADNPWFAIPARAAAEVLGQPEPTDPRAPGPMAFQDCAYVEDILDAAGWQGVETSQVQLTLTPNGSVADIAAFTTRLGPASQSLKDRGGSEEDTRKIAAAVARAMARYEVGGVVRVPAVLNLIRARR